MKSGWRLAVLGTGAIGIALAWAKASFALPAVGHAGSAYATALLHLSLAARHCNDAVTAVNFDIRAMDTLGEEFILFISVMGAAVLLRQEHERRPAVEDRLPGRPAPGPSEAVRLWMRALLAPSLIFGFDLVTHGQATPGGGFQGGVLLGTVPLMVYLSSSAQDYLHIAPQPWAEMAEGAGASGFAWIGIVGLAVTRQFLGNFLGLGQPGAIFSAGIIPLVSLTVGVEVATGFVLLLSAFIQETLEARREEVAAA